MPSVILLENLTKDYAGGWLRRRRHRALDHLTVEVREGEIFGLLGPNGAGKTTTVKLLLHLLRPTMGTVRLFGCSPDEPAVRAHVGFLPEHPYFPEAMTGRELLDFFGRLFGLSRSDRSARIAAVLRQVGLDVSVADRPLRQLSRGELTRVGLAQALLNDPKLLILDDPMWGLDPDGRRQVRDLLLRAREEGKTIFLSTSQAAEAEILCDRVALLYRGRLRACGSPTELAASQGGGMVEVLARGLDAEACAVLRARGLEVHVDRALLRIRVPGSTPVWEGIEAIRHLGGYIIALNPLRSPLERFFEEGVTSSETSEA
jgi:ABC-2 type transport system ATP-binding protein